MGLFKPAFVKDEYLTQASKVNAGEGFATNFVPLSCIPVPVKDKDPMVLKGPSVDDGQDGTATGLGLLSTVTPFVKTFPVKQVQCEDPVIEKEYVGHIEQDDIPLLEVYLPA